MVSNSSRTAAMDERSTRGKYASVRFLLGPKIALNWFIVEVKDDATFASIAEEMRSASSETATSESRFRFRIPEAVQPRCYVAKGIAESVPGKGMEVSLSLSVRDICAQFGEYVTFLIPANEDGDANSSASAGRPNAFSMMMSSSQAAAAAVHLPEKKGIQEGGTCTRGDWRLFNELRDALERAGLGFRKDQAPTVGKQCVTAVSEVLFEVSNIL